MIDNFLESIKTCTVKDQLKVCLILLTEIGANIYNANKAYEQYWQEGMLKAKLDFIKQAEEIKNHIIRLFNSNAED